MTPGPVQKLREELDLEGIDWREVQGYPTATYIPATLHTIWWQGPTTLEFLWGHDFQHHDPDAQAVITRLKGLA